MTCRIVSLLVTTLVLLAGVLPTLACGQESVPVHLEPRHRLALDSTRFRVLDVQIARGDTTLFHVHSTAIMYVTVSVSATSSQTAGGNWPSAAPAANPRGTPGDVRVDSSYIARPLTHRVTNNGTGLFRLIAIISSGPAGAGGGPAQPSLPGAREISSTWYDQSRVPLAATEITEWLTSSTPILVVLPTEGRAEVEIDGSPSRLLSASGEFVLVPGGARYRIANRASQMLALVAVAIK